MEIPAGFGQVTVRYSGSGVPLGAANTFGIANSLGGSAAAVGAAFKASWELYIQPLLVQNTGVQDYLVKLGPNATGPSAIVASGAAGGDLSAQAPPNVALLVSKNTALGGRKGRGRCYLPGVDETQVLQGGTLETAYRNAIQLALTSFLADLAAEDIPMVLLHNDLTVPSVVTSLELSATVATQRRRLRK